ncbi:MAG: hypothetical protein RLZZ385_1377 [Pseudomonadota bacterium]|jgi:sodium/proline symporter
MNASLPVIASFLAYLGLVLGIGALAYRRTHSIDDYLLGGRRLGPVVTALSAGASDMSGWLLLGLPGAVYLAGLREIWIGVGLVLGAWVNWLLVSRRLRLYSAVSHNALTLPDYFESRFRDHSRALRVASASVILLFFTFYTASGLVGGAVLFESSFGLNYHVALVTGAVIIVSYTFLGGFLAVCWTDAVQATLMMAALLMAPLLVWSATGGGTELFGILRETGPGALQPLAGLTVLGWVSLCAWGLGYFGQPHILARFMAVGDPARLVQARRIAMIWMVVVLLGAVMTGLAGKAYFAGDPLTNPETVFILLSQQLFNPWIAGLVAAAILSAIMSTIDSQLLVSSSVISEDFYRVFLRPQASPRELLLVRAGGGDHCLAGFAGRHGSRQSCAGSG